MKLQEVLILKGLTNREAEVAEQVSKGLSNKEIADKLFVTDKTVKFHLTSIYKKLGTKSRSQLVVWCLGKGDYTEAPAAPAPKIQTNTALFNPEEDVQALPVGR